jgi:hypothetical protein
MILSKESITGLASSELVLCSRIIDALVDQQAGSVAIIAVNVFRELLAHSDLGSLRLTEGHASL